MSAAVFMPARMTGSCRSGAESDRGQLVHRITMKAWDLANGSVSMAAALCGATPRRNSAGWEAMTPVTATTCAECQKRLIERSKQQPSETTTVTIERGIDARHGLETAGDALCGHGGHLVDRRCGLALVAAFGDGAAQLRAALLQQ